MYVFIDESGDAGYKFESGSSRYFVVACLILRRAEQVDLLRQSLNEIKFAFNWRFDQEFKFSKMKPALQARVLEGVDFATLCVRVFYIDKSEYPRGYLSHSEMLKLSLQRISEDLVEAIVKIDGASGSSHKRIIGAFRPTSVPESQPRSFRSIRLVKSETEVLIQLADLVAGVARRSFSANREDKDFYRALLGRILTSQDSLIERLK